MGDRQFRQRKRRRVVLGTVAATVSALVVTSCGPTLSMITPPWSEPQAVVLQHAPGRKFRSYTDDVPHLPVGTVERETELIKFCGGCDVIGIAINPESMDRDEVVGIISEYEKRYGIPACDVLVDGPDKIVDAIVRRFFSKS